MMISCILSGSVGIFVPTSASAAVAHTLPRIVQLVWYGGLVAGGLLALYGEFRNLFIERLAVTMLTGIVIGYQVVIISVSPRPFTFASITTFAFSVACIWRIVQINRILKRES
jgi:hypothetical protein